MPAQSTKRWTAAEVRALIEESTTGERFELIDGELLVTAVPRPVHQDAIVALIERLSGYCRRERFGKTVFSPADLELKSGRITQPDVFVLPFVPGTRRIKAWSEVTHLRTSIRPSCPTRSPGIPMTPASRLS
jgi:Uma2 family endonuclease